MITTIIEFLRSLTNLQILLLIIAFSFMTFFLRIYKRKKIGFFSFLLFFFGSVLIAVFALKVQRLNAIGITFGLSRGADLIVYLSIVFLFFLYLKILNSILKNQQNISDVISGFAIQEAYNKYAFLFRKWEKVSYLDDFVFNVRVYNEGKVLSSTIDKLINFGVRKMVFIDDGSQDDSLEILKAKEQEYPNCMIIILHHVINRGGGAANKTGYEFIKRYNKELKVQWMVGFDPDGQMDIKDFLVFKEMIQKNHNIDIFLGSRFIKGAKVVNMPFMRKFILLISKLVTKLFYGINITDPHNGYRVFSIDALSKIKISSDGMNYANEINEQIALLGLKTLEVPVNIRYTDYSLHKGQKNSNSIKLGFQMIFKKFFG